MTKRYTMLVVPFLFFLLPSLYFSLVADAIWHTPVPMILVFLYSLLIGFYATLFWQRKWLVVGNLFSICLSFWLTTQTSSLAFIYQPFRPITILFFLATIELLFQIIGIFWARYYLSK